MDDGSSGSSEIKKSEAATEVFEENGTDTQSQEFSVINPYICYNDYFYILYFNLKLGGIGY